MSSHHDKGGSLDDTIASPPVVATGLDDVPRGGERYVLGSSIGEGGMGEVLEATDTQIGRAVAIKRMRGAAEIATSRFLREARIQGRLEHPAIVPVHEVSVDEAGRPFFVMKRLAGTTLQAILQGSVATESPSAVERYSRQALLRAFADVCLAVEFAHTRGVIHRDLKPANIMLGDFGEVYVLDWGIARVLDGAEPDQPAGVGESAEGMTEVGAVLGTIGYMSPEQARGDTVDRSADVYALGCILFEILAGQPLHKRGALAAVFEPYDARPSQRVPDRDIPPELDALCVASTAHDAADRPSSARELARAAQRYIDGDRDVALRRRLAAEQLALAFSAPERAGAIRHAGRALALDPTSSEAAQLVGRIMLEPAVVTPPEVEAELAGLDDASLRQVSSVAFGAFMVYLSFLPLIWWAGLRDPAHLGLLAGASVVNGVISGVVWRSQRASAMLLRAVVLGNVALIGLAAWLFSPFLVAPGLAAATMVGFSMHIRFGPTWLLATLLASSIIVPWLGELVGPLPRSIEVVGGALALHVKGGGFQLPEAEIVLAIYVIAVLAVIGTLSHALARGQREARRTIHLQAWHLRQLVPLGDGAASRS